MKRVANQFDSNLLLLLGEQIKQPLIAISQLSELSKQSNINAHAKHALSTIDNILLYQRVHSGQIALKLEPVHVGSAISDVVTAMEPLMKAVGCKQTVKIQHSLSPVDVDRRVLYGALSGLWQTVVGVLSDSSELICSAKKTKEGIRLSVTSRTSSIDAINLKDANPNSVQPIVGLAGPATDLLASKGMFNLLGSQLTKTSGKNQSGFGVTLKVSRQLQIL